MRVKNVSGSTKVYSGQTLDNNQEHDIAAIELTNWQSDDDVIADASSGNLLIGDGSVYKTPGAQAISFLLGVDTTPKDQTGRPIFRSATTIEGWHYQLLSIEISTSKYQGYYNADENGTDIGFVTHKMYKQDGTEITSSADEALAVKTSVWIRPTHSYEVIGAIFGQSAPPSTDMRMFVTGLPGVYNVKFSRGGINLKHAGSGTYQMVDGRSSKYLAYVSQVPDANSFKFTILHDEGVAHSFQVSLEIFKSP